MGIRQYNINLAAPKIKFQFDKSDEVYVDTSFLLHSIIDHRKLDPSVNKLPYKFAQNFLADLVQKKIPILVCSLAFAEFWHVCLKLLYEKEHGRNTWTSTTLKDRPDIITKYGAGLEKFQRSILKYRDIRIIGIPGEIVGQAFHNMLAFNLSPFDSFHFCVCCFEKTKWFITGDQDFKRIPPDGEDEDIDLRLIIY